MKREIEIPDALHPDTAQLIVDFAEAVAAKARAAEEKYEFGNGWACNDWQEECRDDFFSHVLKGDPRDVALYAAFMWKHGWKTGIPTLLRKAFADVAELIGLPLKGRAR